MNGCCVKNQVKQGEGEKHKPGERTDGACAGEPGAKSDEVTDVGEMAAVDPEVVSVFIEDEHFAGETSGEHPFPFGHDRLG